MESKSQQGPSAEPVPSGSWPDDAEGPALDRSDRWQPTRYSIAELAAALVEARVAGPVTSHDRRNVAWKARLLVHGEPHARFGIRGLDGVSFEQVMTAMADQAGFDPDPALAEEDTPIDPLRVLAACERAGDRLALAAERGERAIIATGHPGGLFQLYVAVGDVLSRRGAKLLRPLEGYRWREMGRRREIRYLRGVAFLSGGGSALHTHAAGPMELMLEEAQPDLVFADHGFAGAAIQAGVDTISIADVNDHPPVVAKWQGRTETVIVMDDNVRPEGYWPCFQMIASRFPHEERRHA